MDYLSSQDTVIHRLDSRIKLLVTLVFLVCVVSFGKYEVSALLPFFMFPVVLTVLAELPVGFLLKRMLIVLPFAFFAGIANPMIDQEILVRLGPVNITGGWISFLSILLRFCLCVSAALILLAATGINGVCHAFDRLGAPRAFTVQLLFLYRYIFLLADEGLRMSRARSARSFGRQGLGVKVHGSLIGHLLLRALDRAQRIYTAMMCRGFDGRIDAAEQGRLCFSDLVFGLGCCGAFILFRVYNVSRLAGLWLTGGGV